MDLVGQVSNGNGCHVIIPAVFAVKAIIMFVLTALNKGHDAEILSLCMLDAV